MTRAPRTTLHRVVPQLLFLPHASFSALPHISPLIPLSSPLHARSPAASARPLPIEPEHTHFSIRHRSRESCTRSHHPSTTQQPCRPARILSAQWGPSRLGLGDGIPISAHRSAIPELYRTKGTCIAVSTREHVQQTTCDCGRYRSI